MNFMEKVTKQSKKLTKVAGKKIDAVKNKSKKIIKDSKIKKNVAKLSKNVGEFANKTYDTTKEKSSEIVNNVEKFADKTYDLAKDKSNDIIMEAKLKIDINENIKKIKNIYEAIGSSVYDTYKKGEKVNDTFLIECKVIEKINNELHDMSARELDLKKLKKCDKCNKTINSDDKFCISCGTQQKSFKTEEKTK